MRQRIPPKGPKGETWEKMEGDSSTHGGSNINTFQPVPMYHPLHFPHSAKPTSAQPFQSSSYHDDYRSNYYQDNNTKFFNEPAHSSSSRLSALDAPTFIPDSKYANFVRTGSLQSPKKRAFCNRLCCAKFCLIYSWVAISFMIFVGLLYDSQPLYLPGALPKHYQQSSEGSRKREQVYYDLSTSDRLPAASNAYRAAFFCFFLSCLCIAYIYHEHTGFLSKMRGYHEIPDNDSTAPTLPSAVSASLSLPMHATNEPPGTPRRSSVVKSHGGTSIAQNMRVTYNRARLFLASNWPTLHDHRRARRREAGPKDV